MAPIAGKARLWPLAAIAMLIAAASGTSTEAGPQAAGAGSMMTGGLTSQPIGHYEFCRATPAECVIRPRDRGPERMTEAKWAAVARINVAVNKAVKPMNDIDIYGKDEVWAYPDLGVGDCEDYVLEKRRQIAGTGISLANLLITVVRKPDGEGHAILTLRSDRGDYVLDNLHDELRPWFDTGYRFLKRQASNHTGRWVSLREDQNMLVGALK